MNLSFLHDKTFLRTMLGLALPVAFQQLITAGMNMLDVLMVGQLGEASIAALGLANQIFFLLILFLFGVTSGMAIFTAQFWGKEDVESIRLVLGICLTAAVTVGLSFALAALFIPETLMRFYTEDPQVVSLGASYLRIVGFSYVFMGVTTSYMAVLRSITWVKLTVGVSVIAILLKTGLAYLLIFGVGGLPALGVRGAALATTIAWTFESLLIVGLSYALKSPLAANPGVPPVRDSRTAQQTRPSGLYHPRRGLPLWQPPPTRTGFLRVSRRPAGPGRWCSPTASGR